MAGGYAVDPEAGLHNIAYPLNSYPQVGDDRHLSS